jgi:hypothetical protein
MKDWLEKHHAECKKLSYASYTLYGIADCLGRVGNESLSYEIHEIASIVDSARKELPLIIGEKTRNDLALAQQSSANVLKACLAGTRITKE